MGKSVLPLLVVAMVPIISGTIGQRALIKRNPQSSLQYPDYPKYDDFPVLPKRAALLFDQLMVALKKVVDNQERGELTNDRSGFGRSSSSHNENGNPKVIPSADEETMDLQRRGQAKGRVYWRCYFNAVTCFKRK